MSTDVIYAIDFGTADALAIHGPAGPVSKKTLKLKKVPGGRTPAMEFIMVAEALMHGGDEVPAGDIVVESATIGSSGCEVGDVIRMMERNPDRSIFTITTRAVMNFRGDHPEYPWKKGARYAKDGVPVPQPIDLLDQVSVHREDALIIYMIATQTPWRLYRWRGPSTACERIFSSVRPMDKHLYRNERAEELMALLPAFRSLPQELQGVLGTDNDYARTRVMPFAMASQEPYVDAGPREYRRSRYTKLIGLYDRGYPSYYRRATIVWMLINLRLLAGVTRKAEATPEQRKQAWKVTQRQVRQFFHLTMAHQGR
jgi:hypothetical protein